MHLINAHNEKCFYLPHSMPHERLAPNFCLMEIIFENPSMLGLADIFYLGTFAEKIEFVLRNYSLWIINYGIKCKNFSRAKFG